MFRLTGFLLPLLFAASLGPDSVAARPDATPLRVATFQCDVTPPPDGHPLIWVTPVKEVETPLLAKGIVLDDGSARYVLAAVDWCGLCNSSHRLFRAKIAAAAQTDIANVTVNSVHLPGEAMIEFQLFAQQLKPDGFVAVAAYGDLGPGYICTEKSFSEGGYEPTASRAGMKSEWVLKKAIEELLEVR